jgi:1-acyl-sn-glycerol-3-phosphate acyltransferase
VGTKTTSRAEGRNRQKRKSWTDQQSVFVYRVAQFLVGLLFRFWAGGFRAVGVENIPATGGAFLIANHTSGVDPFVLGYPIKRRLLRGPGKVEIFESRFFSFFMRRLGMFPLRQGVADAAAVRTMVELYRNGRVVAIYPEGGRSQSGELRPFSPEFARLAIKLRAPLVPAAIAGARDFLPIGTYRPRRHAPIAVVFGKPFDLSLFYDQTLTPELLERAAAWTQSKVAELLPEARAERAALLKG